MTTAPAGDGKEEEGGAGEEAPAAAVVCVSSESFLEKRGRDGERSYLGHAWNAVCRSLFCGVSVWPSNI